MAIGFTAGVLAGVTAPAKRTLESRVNTVKERDTLNFFMGDSFSHHAKTILTSIPYFEDFVLLCRDKFEKETTCVFETFCYKKAQEFLRNT
jgi:hypothetical protein